MGRDDSNTRAASKSKWPDLSGPAILSEESHYSSGYWRVSVMVVEWLTVPLVAFTAMV